MLGNLLHIFFYILSKINYCLIGSCPIHHTREDLLCDSCSSKHMSALQHSCLHPSLLKIRSLHTQSHICILLSQWWTCCTVRVGKVLELTATSPLCPGKINNKPKNHQFELCVFIETIKKCICCASKLFNNKVQAVQSCVMASCSDLN